MDVPAGDDHAVALEARGVNREDAHERRLAGAVLASACSNSSRSVETWTSTSHTSLAERATPFGVPAFDDLHGSSSLEAPTATGIRSDRWSLIWLYRAKSG